MTVLTYGSGSGITRSWTATLTAKEPLAHFAEGDDSNNSKLRRLVVMYNGQPIAVPAISGNSFRGIWRRLLASDLLARVGLSFDAVGPRVTYLLTSGFGLEAADKKAKKGKGEETPPAPTSSLQIGDRETLRKNLPMVSLLGTSYGNSMVEGTVRVGWAIPVCEATAAALGVESNVAPGDLVGETFASRRDDHIVEEKAEKLASAAQMIFRYEYIVPGAVLRQSFGVEAASELEVSCLAYAIALFKERPFVGGKWASGHGRVEADYPDLGVAADIYRAWLDEHKQEVADYLLALDPKK